MMAYAEDEARTKFCPIGQWKSSYDLMTYCRASECMMWQWQPLLADDKFKEAVQRAAEELKDTSPARKKAVAYVVANRLEYGLPDKPYKGYCGLTGKSAHG